MKKYLLYSQYYRPKLGEAWFVSLVIFMLLGMMIGAACVLIFSPLFGGKEVLSANPLAILVTYCIPFVITWGYFYLRAAHCYSAAQVQGLPPYTLPKAQLGKVSVVGFLILLVLATIALLFVEEPLTDWMEMPETLKNMFEKMLSPNILSFITVAVAAPLLEEWLLRRKLLNGLLHHLRPGWAIFWSAVLFGIIHANPFQAIPAILIGCFIGWVYYRTRSYWACVFIHFVNNGTSFALTLLFPEMEADSGMSDLVGASVYPYTLAAAVLVLAGVIWYFAKKLAPAPVLTVPTPEVPAEVPAETYGNQ